jgi:ABC-type oligopeptide transport system ATPase subunit
MVQQKDTMGVTYIFITHDLSLAWVISDRIAVMYLGRIVESGDTEEVVADPKHPYTKALISVIPVPDPLAKREHVILKGETPNPVSNLSYRRVFLDFKRHVFAAEYFFQLRNKFFGNFAEDIF